MELKDAKNASKGIELTELVFVSMLMTNVGILVNKDIALTVIDCIS